MLKQEGNIIDLEVLADPKKAKTLYKETLDEKIKSLKDEIETLKRETLLKKAELQRCIKRRSIMNKED